MNFSWNFFKIYLILSFRFFLFNLPSNFYASPSTISLRSSQSLNERKWKMWMKRYFHFQQQYQDVGEKPTFAGISSILHSDQPNPKILKTVENPGPFQLRSCHSSLISNLVLIAAATIVDSASACLTVGAQPR